METLSNYFSSEAIILLLCKYRIKHARKRHKLHVLCDISKHETTINNFNNDAHLVPGELKEILPSRRQWITLNEKDRKRYKNSTDLYVECLRRTIVSVYINVKENKIAAPVWYINLQEYINYIKGCVSEDSSHVIGKPKIFPEIKEKGKEKTECRPLAVYKFVDRIIISLIAKYLTDLFDDFLVDNSSFAFRSVKGKTIKNHHSTVTEIKTYRDQNKDKELWVAECDIRKFFDCVNHNIAISVFEKFVNKVKMNGGVYDENATIFFKQYLDSYSFNEDVYPLNSNLYFQQQRIMNGFFSWPKEELETVFYHSGVVEKVGVPQGGAISCLIANLVLHYADELITECYKSDLRYLRFCDDMVIISPNEKICEDAFVKYNKAMGDLKLLTHPPKKFPVYNSGFWGNSAKSKAPYKWAKREKDSPNVPWLSFVGYQIRYDSQIRIRAKSLRKEIIKQKTVTKDVMKAIRTKDSARLNINSRKAKRQQLISLESRLISMSVGRIDLKNKGYYQPSYCWLVGFNIIRDNKIIEKQLKALDKSRNRQLYIFKKSLATLSKEIHKPEKNDISKYRGAPFSYHYFLKNNRLPA